MYKRQVLIRFPRALYGLLSLAAIFGLLYELWNGFAPLGYGFLFYLLLCYPIVLVGILFYEKNSESETKIIHYWLYAIFPLTLALINQAFPVFVLLLACELFIFCCGLKLKWLKWNRVNIFGVACMLIFLIMTWKKKASEKSVQNSLNWQLKENRQNEVRQIIQVIPLCLRIPMLRNF